MLFKREYTYFICIEYTAVNEDNFIYTGKYDAIVNGFKKLKTAKDFKELSDKVETRFLQLTKYKSVKFNFIALNRI